MGSFGQPVSGDFLEPPELSSDCLLGDLALDTRRSVLTCAPLAVLPFPGLDAGLQWVFLYGFLRPIVC